MADDGERGAGTRRGVRRALALAAAAVITLGCAACGSAGPPPEVTPSVVEPATGDGSGTAGANPRSPGAPGGENGGGVSPDVVAAARLAQARRDALRDGLIAYRPPSPMRQGDVQRVVVRASGIEQRQQLLAGLPPAAPGQVVTTPLGVGLTLSAELGGEGFVVTPVGSGDPTRPSLTGDVAEWQWDITPTESGAKHLTLVVRSYYGDATAPAAVRYVDAPIQVGFDLGYSVARTVSSPGWAATGLTVPVVATAVIALGRRRRKAREQRDGGVVVPTPARSPGSDGPRGYL